MTTRVWNFLEKTQILSTNKSRSSPAAAYEVEGVRNHYYRHVSQGGWPFSTSAHGWPISDCTAEGLKAVLSIRDLPCVSKSNSCRPIADERLFDAANVILTLQNSDGGWATYENTRGGLWYEHLNPSETFGDIMVDISYCECTTAAVTALVDFSMAFPSHRADEVSSSIQAGAEFLRSVQRADGSWYGSWGCCFTYGCWFGLDGLAAAGEPNDSEAILKSISFLIKHQNDDGGWGEDFTSCYDKSYAHALQSQVVQTAWAMLGLMAADPASDDCTEALSRGASFLRSRQLPSGDWPQESITGAIFLTLSSHSHFK